MYKRGKNIVEKSAQRLSVDFCWKQHVDNRQNQRHNGRASQLTQQILVDIWYLLYPENQRKT